MAQGQNVAMGDVYNGDRRGPGKELWWTRLNEQTLHGPSRDGCRNVVDPEEALDRLSSKPLPWQDHFWLLLYFGFSCLNCGLLVYFFTQRPPDDENQLWDSWDTDHLKYIVVVFEFSLVVFLMLDVTFRLGRAWFKYAGDETEIFWRDMLEVFRLAGTILSVSALMGLKMLRMSTIKASVRTLRKTVNNLRNREENAPAALLLVIGPTLYLLFLALSFVGTVVKVSLLSDLSNAPLETWSAGDYWRYLQFILNILSYGGVAERGVAKAAILSALLGQWTVVVHGKEMSAEGVFNILIVRHLVQGHGWWKDFARFNAMDAGDIDMFIETRDTKVTVVVETGSGATTYESPRLYPSTSKGRTPDTNNYPSGRRTPDADNNPTRAVSPLSVAWEYNSTPNALPPSPLPHRNANPD
eukprot:gene13742-19642_t